MIGGNPGHQSQELYTCVHTGKGARHGGSDNLLLSVGNDVGVSVVEWWGPLSGMIEALGSIPAAVLRK